MYITPYIHYNITSHIGYKSVHACAVYNSLCYIRGIVHYTLEIAIITLEMFIYREYRV